MALAGRTRRSSRSNGSAADARDVDYKAAVKPVSRAHFARTLVALARCRTRPRCDHAGHRQRPGRGRARCRRLRRRRRYGKGVRITANTEYVAFPQRATSTGRRARVEFWYQPHLRPAHDGVHHDICGYLRHGHATASCSRSRSATPSTSSIRGRAGSSRPGQGGGRGLRLAGQRLGPHHDWNGTTRCPWRPAAARS